MNHFYMLPERAFRLLGGRMTLEGGGKNKAPDAPDYAAAAAEQAQSSKEVTNMQNYANRPSQVTPWGRTDWTTQAQIDPATGQAVTSWTQNETLAPQAQQALDSQLAVQQGRSDLAQGFMGRVGEAYKDPFSYAGMPERANTPQAIATQAGQGIQGSVRDYNLNTGAPTQTTQAQTPDQFASERQRIEQGMFDRMAPEHERASSNLDQQLANKGLTPGSEAYKFARQELADRQDREKYNALMMGGEEQQRLQQMALSQQGQAFGQDVAGQQAQNVALGQQFGQGLQGGQFANTAQQQGFGQQLGANAQNFGQNMQSAQFQNQNRQQAIAEEAQRRGMSLNEMNALLTGQQVQTPQMPSFMGAQAAQPVQALGAAQAQGNYDMAAYNADQQGTGALWGGLGSLAGSAAAMF